ncbi:cobalt ABC transporter [Maritimibacter sp. 55A14]|uniref:energy-coupling factor ABC transporter ATP-binding protein n=1 Tax=Maritimibacter sp. 55A14 TaxID=2174844 RepID=UPI000D610603|nr:ABC transporter ATP-binding protein [Maritimibacter sp. 55A14]PWE33773.1 cobalt ABC transporter [Maritimibacter sp. 55A14]
MQAGGISETGAGARLTGVSCRLGARQAIDGLTLDLTERRIGVVGRNGSGKSTLARLVCGLIAPDAGTVRVGGVDVASDRAAAIRQVGILFQNPDHQIIFPTVEEELAFGLGQLGQGRDAARQGAHAMLKRFGRAHWAYRAVHTLSQGQRHLVCLMAVLAMEPRLIVLDEPFAGLDIPTTRALGRYLDGLDQQLLHISHDPAALTRYDRVLWLEAGRLAMDGPAGTVLAAFTEAMEARDDRTDLAD